VLLIRKKNYGFGSRSETGQNFFFFVLKFLPSLIFKHKKAALPQLRDLATHKVRHKLAGFESGSISKRHESADPDPYQKVMDLQHCAQLFVKVFYCTATVASTCKCEICTYNHMNNCSLKKDSFSDFVRIQFRFRIRIWI
jgi:hypothetical protein